MKKLILNIIGLFLVLGICILGLEYAYKDYINPVDYRLKPLEVISSDVETLILGASHTQAIGNQEIIKNQNCYNTSMGGQDLLHTFLILKSFIEKMNKLKTVVVELEYHSLGYNFADFNQVWKDRQYYTYTNQLDHNDWVSQLLAKSTFQRSNRDFSYLINIFSNQKQEPIRIKEIIESLKERKTVAQKNDFIPLTNKEFNLTDCKKRAFEQSRIKYKKSLVPQNKEILEKIIQLSKVKNINLILLNTPKTSCYIDNYLTNKEMGKMKNEIKFILKKYKLEYYDFLESKSFNDSDFADYDHLNVKGVSKLIKKIYFLTKSQNV